MRKLKSIIISVHDVSPLFKKELKSIFSYLNKLKIVKREAFVVINWLEKYPLEKDKELVNLLKENFKLGEINFHGGMHYSQDKSFRDKILFGEDHSYNGEFRNKAQSEIETNFKTNLGIFRKLFGRKPLVFIPSRWDNSNEILGVCSKFGIKYSEDVFHLIHIKDNIKKFSFALCLDFGDNRLLNMLSKTYAHIIIFLSSLFNLPLRFSIHPNDVRNGNMGFEMKLLKRLINSGWKPVSTQDFWGGEGDS